MLCSRKTRKWYVWLHQIISLKYFRFLIIRENLTERFNRFASNVENNFFFSIRYPFENKNEVLKSARCASRDFLRILFPRAFNKESTVNEKRRIKTSDYMCKR